MVPKYRFRVLCKGIAPQFPHIGSRVLDPGSQRKGPRPCVPRKGSGSRGSGKGFQVEGPGFRVLRPTFPVCQSCRLVTYNFTRKDINHKYFDFSKKRFYVLLTLQINYFHIFCFNFGMAIFKEHFLAAA